jgi:hypothetical protein
MRSDQAFATSEIEDRAMRLLHRAREASIWDGSAPIPVELIAEELSRLTIEWTLFRPRPDGPRVLGALDPATRGLLLNDGERVFFQTNPGVERFTIAHEIGHLDLHVRDDDEVSSVCAGNDGSGREVEAERFAAALLMPKELVRGHAAGTNTGLWPRVYSLCEIFGVSASAMRYRLRDLGYKVPAELIRWDP